ncbi:MAG: alpha/beta fold hydrolase [Terracidiphilus sp.]
MEFFLVVLGVIAIVAFVRSSNLRKELDAHLQEYRDKVTDLTGEIFRLKQELSQLSKPVTPEKATAKPSETAHPAVAPATPIPANRKAEEGRLFEYGGEQAGAMRLHNKQSIDNFLFTVAITIASQSLILRNRLLDCFRKAALQEDADLMHSRHTIVSGYQLLDAVYVAPVTQSVRAVVLLCHGIAETVDDWLGVQRLLADQGVASLVFDYAGYGRSSGNICWEQCEADAIASFRALKALQPDTPVSILGFSLGSGIATAVLDRVSPSRLILCSSFTSFQAAVCRVGLPRRLSLLTPQIWNTEETLRLCTLPVLVLHCEQDRLFPTQMALTLASSCQGCVKLVIVSRQRHNDPFNRPELRYWAHVVSFLASDTESD